MTISVDMTDDQMKVMLMYAETKSMTIADLIEYRRVDGGRVERKGRG